MTRMKFRVWQAVLAAMVLALPLGMTGCGAFFVCDKASCTTNGTGTNSTADYAYVSNSSTGITYLNGYALASGTLVATTGSPYSISYAPSAMVVSEANTFLYVGSNAALVTGSGTNSIYGYSIGTGGALTVLNSGSALLTSEVAAMTVSPDGQWLLVLTINDGINLPTLTVYSINASTGALTFSNSQNCIGITGQTATPYAVKISPNSTYVAVALGLGGIATYPFTTSGTSGGLLGGETQTSLNVAAPAVFDLRIDTNNYLYAAYSGGLVTFPSSSTGVLGGATTYTTGTSLSTSVAIDGTSYVYAGASTTTGSTTTSSVYEFTNAGSGKLTALNSVTAPTTLQRLAVDNTGKFVLAAGLNASSGLQMYAIGSTGALTFTSSMPTSVTTSAQTYMALTH